MNGTPTIKKPENLSSTFRDYLAKTLEVDAEKRPDATQLLQHPFFAIATPLRTLAPLVKDARKAKAKRRAPQSPKKDDADLVKGELEKMGLM
jgi:p21-activated kinase 1